MYLRYWGIALATSVYLGRGMLHYFTYSDISGIPTIGRRNELNARHITLSSNLI